MSAQREPMHQRLNPDSLAKRALSCTPPPSPWVVSAQSEPAPQHPPPPPSPWAASAQSKPTHPCPPPLPWAASAQRSAERSPTNATLTTTPRQRHSTPATALPPQQHNVTHHPSRQPLSRQHHNALCQQPSHCQQPRRENTAALPLQPPSPPPKCHHVSIAPTPAHYLIMKNALKDKESGTKAVWGTKREHYVYTLFYLMRV